MTRGAVSSALVPETDILADETCQADGRAERPEPGRQLPALRTVLRRARADLEATASTSRAVAELLRYAPR